MAAQLAQYQLSESTAVKRARGVLLPSIVLSLTVRLFLSIASCVSVHGQGIDLASGLWRKFAVAADAILSEKQRRGGSTTAMPVRSASTHQTLLCVCVCVCVCWSVNQLRPIPAFASDFLWLDSQLALQAQQQSESMKIAHCGKCYARLQFPKTAPIVRCPCGEESYVKLHAEANCASCKQVRNTSGTPAAQRTLPRLHSPNCLCSVSALHSCCDLTRMPSLLGVPCQCNHLIALRYLLCCRF